MYPFSLSTTLTLWKEMVSIDKFILPHFPITNRTYSYNIFHFCKYSKKLEHPTGFGPAFSSVMRLAVRIGGQYGCVYIFLETVIAIKVWHYSQHPLLYFSWLLINYTG